MELLIVADVDGWAYHTRAQALKKYAPPDFTVEVVYHSSPAPGHRLLKDVNLADYDCVLSLDYQSPISGKVLAENKDMVYVVSHNRDSSSMLERWRNTYRQIESFPRGYVVCNNREVWEYHGRKERTCNISNGIDGEVWRRDVPMADRERRVLWYGGANPKKGKGYWDVLRPLEKMLSARGFEPCFRPYHSGRDPAAMRGEVAASPPVWEWAWDQPRMRRWYNTGFAIVVASAAEGTPGITLEGMACGCVPVTTRVGNALEFGVDRENVVFSERRPEAMLDAIVWAWEHRYRLSDAAVATMRKWTYGPPGNRAEYFYSLFRALRDCGSDGVNPFSYEEISPREI